MEFYDVPLRVETTPKDNATVLLLDRVKKNPNHALFSRKNSDGSWRNVTSAEFLSEVQTLAKGLISAGIKPGDAVALMSRTRYESRCAIQKDQGEHPVGLECLED
ncbi:MAG: AMP-binding protein [Aquiluna sp.]